MSCKVEFHRATFEQYFKPVDADYSGLSARLQQDFATYIDSGRELVPRYFGRDAPYTEPQFVLNAHLSHIHIKLPPGQFRQDVCQYDRTCARGRPDQDAALVYVQGELEEDHYLLLAFFNPDAHGVARNMPAMRYLAQLATDWRNEN